MWFYHYTQSFSPDESITGEQAHKLAMEFAEKSWPDSQILVATHIDREHIHSHFLVNAVCYESGYMLRQGPTTLTKLRKLSDEICLAHGFSVLSPDLPKHSKQLSAREYRSMEKNQSWKMQLMIAIEDAMALARSKNHFIKLLREKGYQVKWTDERKSITYTTPSGMKCRDVKLSESKFLKEMMENEFELRAKILGGIERPGSQAASEMEPCLTATEKSWKALIGLQDTLVQLLVEVQTAEARLATKEELVEYLDQRVQELGNCTLKMQSSAQRFQREMERSASEIAKNLSLQAGRMSEDFSRNLYLEQERMRKHTDRLFWIALIPSAVLVILELISHIFPLILPG